MRSNGDLRVDFRLRRQRRLTLASLAAVLSLVACAGADPAAREPEATPSNSVNAPPPSTPDVAEPTPPSTPARGGVIATFENSLAPRWWDSNGDYAAVVIPPDSGFDMLPVRLFDLGAGEELSPISGPDVNGSCGVRLVEATGRTYVAVIEVKTSEAQGIVDASAEAFLAFYDVASGQRVYAMLIADDGTEYEGPNCVAGHGTGLSAVDLVFNPTSDQRYGLVYLDAGEWRLELGAWKATRWTDEPGSAYVLGNWFAIPIEANDGSLRRVELQDPETSEGAGSIPADEYSRVSPSEGDVPVVVGDTWVRGHDALALPSGRVRWRLKAIDRINFGIETPIALHNKNLLVLGSDVGGSKPQVRALDSHTGEVLWEVTAQLCGAADETVWVVANDSLAQLDAATGGQRSFTDAQDCPMIGTGAMLARTDDGGAHDSWVLTSL